MNHANTKTSLIAAAVLLAAMSPAVAREYGPRDEGRRFNDGSRVVCHKEEERRNGSDPNRVGGTVAGAVIGGLVGNQIGSGNGRKLATVGGAIAGGAAGRHIQGKRQESHGDRVVETRCERVYR